MDTPASLLERLRQPGEAEAWDRFVSLYTPLLYNWGRGAGCQEADAADLVQDVLTLLVRKLPEFAYDRQRSFRSWLRTVTLNKLRENQRRGDGRHVATGNGVPEVAGPDDQEAFEDSEYRRYLVQRTLELLQGEFPALTWAAFHQHVVVGDDVPEVARRLGISKGTVYAAKSRVLTRVRQELAGLLD